VKKGFLMGGVEKKQKEQEHDSNNEDDNVRTFCVEWGGM
jgi:hypothetical protein